MLLPSGLSTTDYSRLAHAKGWGPGWPSCGAINGGSIRPLRLERSGTSIAGGVHANITELFALIGNEIERQGYRFVPGWCWGAECRAISGSSTPSNHSWGLAVDINAPTNPYTSTTQHDIPNWAFALLRSYGFGLGADYSGKRDYMHAEFMGTPQDAALMTGLARRSLGGIVIPTPAPTPAPTPKPAPTPAPAPTQTGDDDDMYRTVQNNGRWFAAAPGRFFHIENQDHFAVGQSVGLFPAGDPKEIGAYELDVLRDVCLGNGVDKDLNLTDRLPSDVAQGK
jgi:hypothetical protein